MALQEILEIEQLMDENQGLELTEGNIETVLDEIRPYLVGEQFRIPLSPAAQVLLQPSSTFALLHETSPAYNQALDLLQLINLQNGLLLWIDASRTGC